MVSESKGGLKTLRQDLAAIRAFDPAARSSLEIVLTYPGLHALWLHRPAHWLWKRGFLLIARLISHLSRFLTGVEIHPGARVGAGVFIDHGMGVVIGETATVGDGCILYKGVVLGGNKSERCQRHPQLGARVVVGTNACILGNIEVGDDARIGSGSVVVRAVPAGATVVGVPGRIVPRAQDRSARFEHALDHASLPDPTSDVIRALHQELSYLRTRLEALEQHLSLPADPKSEPAAPWDTAAEATTDLPPQHGG